MEAIASDHDVNHIVSSDAQYLSIIVGIPDRNDKQFVKFEIFLLSLSSNMSKFFLYILFYIFSQTCIKGPPLEPKNSGRC